MKWFFVLALAPIAVGFRSGAAPTRGAVIYYKDQCAHCHGASGSNYANDMGRRLTDAKLRAVIDEMANGPGMAPLSPRDLDAQLNYHRAMLTGKPYFAITRIKGVILEGEADFCDKLYAVWGSKSREIKVEKGRFHTTVPLNIMLNGKLRGKEGKYTVEIPIKVGSTQFQPIR